MITKNLNQDIIKHNNTSLIFLDFDGVLNSYDEGSYVTNPPELYGPSKTICSKIEKLCQKKSAKIIISSNWRKFNLTDSYKFNTNYYSNPLTKVYDLLGKFIIGTLPPYRHITKAEALILWFEETNYQSENWVIIDDDERERLGTTSDYNIKNHYIQTNPKFGITDKVIIEMEKFL